MNDLTPQQIVAELDRYIIGQHRAKKAVAVALRNRQRRRNLPPELRDEIRPKNILMIGPTGVGKTEIARRLARLVNAPFLKVEATKFTEVGYVGRDVESIIKDLTEIAVRMVKEEKTAALREKAQANAEHRLLRILAGLEKPKQAKGPFDLFGVFTGEKTVEAAPGPEEQISLEALTERYHRGELEQEMVQIEVVETPPVPSSMVGLGGLDEIGQGLQEFFSAMLPKKVSLRQVTVAEAREILTQQETEKLIDWDDVYREATQRWRNRGLSLLTRSIRSSVAMAKAGLTFRGKGSNGIFSPLLRGRPFGQNTGR